MYQKSRSYDVCFLRYGVRQNFLSFRVIFCHFTPLTTWKTKILKKWKTYLEISSLYTCVTQTTIIWCMVPEIWSRKTEFFVILDYFLFSFYSSNNPENQHFEKMKKMPRDIILHMCTINGNHKIYGSWDMEQDRHNFFSFFALLPI